MASRSSALVKAPVVALTVSEDTRWRIWLERREHQRRIAATPQVCAVACMAAIEAAQNVARTVFRVDYQTERRLRTDLTPSYVWLRNFLVGELDAEYTLACATAFGAIARE